jgi:hypothetical protein
MACGFRLVQGRTLETAGNRWSRVTTGAQLARRLKLAVVPTVVLVFREAIGQRRLDRLEEPGARDLADILTARRAQIYRLMGAKIRAAANRDPVEEVAEDGDVLLDREELEAIHRACAEEPALQQNPSLKRLCSEVSRALAGL